MLEPIEQHLGGDPSPAGVETAAELLEQLGLTQRDIGMAPGAPYLFALDVAARYEIDADLVPNASAAVQAMLDESGLSARAENWMFNDNFVERLRYEIDPQWQGGIPRTLLIAADGTTTTLEGVADFVQIGAWLDAQPAARNSR